MIPIDPSQVQPDAPGAVCLKQADYQPLGITPEGEAAMKVFCENCKHYRPLYVGMVAVFPDRCLGNAGDSYRAPASVFWNPSIKNANNDCVDFEAEPERGEIGIVPDIPDPRGWWARLWQRLF